MQPSACHPERSRTSVERIATQKREPLGEAGSRNEFRWLAKGMLHFLWEVTQTRLEIPSSLSLLAFTSLLAR